MSVDFHKFYPLADLIPGETAFSQRNIRAKLNGVFRVPKQGEWYVSGALPAGYLAPAGMNLPMYIARLWETETVQQIRGLRPYVKEKV